MKLRGLSGLAVFAVVTGSGIVLTPTSVGAQTGTSAESTGQSQTKAGNDRSRRVCRTLTPANSRLTQRTCRTQAEWDQATDRTQEGVLRFQTTESTQYEQAARPN